MCWGGNWGGNTDCVRTVREVFTTMHGTQYTTVLKGVDIDSDDDSGIPAALAAAQAADRVVLVLGIGYSQEHEGIDRDHITLPGLQTEFATRVLALGKPTVLVLINGGILAIDELVAPAPAIIESFYPSMRGAEALYRAIYGMDNRWGKLPVTMYAAAFEDEQSMYDFDMTTTPGRTYRYYTGKPLFPFGWGLSYTTFAYACNHNATENDESGDVMLYCLLTNTGNFAGDDVLQVYHRVSDDIRSKCGHPVPLRALVDFKRASLNSGEETLLHFVIGSKQLAITDLNGNKVVYAGAHYFDVTNGVSAAVTIEIDVPSTVVIDRAVPPS